LWDFGNGASSASINTTQTFDYDSVYQVLVTVTDTTTGCSDTALQTIIMPADTTTDTTTIGIGIFKERLRISIAPNPFSEFTIVYISGIRNEVSLQLTNLLGEQVSTPVRGSSGNYRVTRDGLPAGVYILSIAGNGNILGNYKLVIH
jgi:hypothetical protein